MQYHAAALAADGKQVDIVGYVDAPLPDSLRESPRIRCHGLSERGFAWRHSLPRPLFLLVAGVRALRQCMQLWWVLTRRLDTPGVLLVQTPPAIPTLLVAWLVARQSRARWIVDWHNFGYSLLALRLGPTHVLVQAARFLERRLGQRADDHLCVSQAMQKQLAANWQIKATVLPDLPAARFRPLAPQERSLLFNRLPELLPGYDPRSETRPALVVSATSWSADEDFQMLLDAAIEYETRRTRQSRELPPLYLLITGRGLLQERYESLFRSRALRHVRMHTAWLSAADYPLVLGAADLGISMHRSASGVDLPMKVADMLGSGLPVCMYDYGPCVREIIEPARDGVLFRNAAQLAAAWADLLTGFPQPTSPLETIRSHLASHRRPSWQEAWLTTAKPLFEAPDSKPPRPHAPTPSSPF